jgi:hypothetical protein
MVVVMSGVVHSSSRIRLTRHLSRLVVALGLGHPCASWLISQVFSCLHVQVDQSMIFMLHPALPIQCSVQYLLQLHKS